MWVIFTDTAKVEGDDATRTALVTDFATGTVTPRPFTEQENASADLTLQEDRQLTDLTARVARIEAHLWPADPEPDPATDPTTFPEFMGIWDNGAITSEAGKAWRNVSGVPLTNPPSGFPGIPAQWKHLFVEVNAVPPADPEPGVPEWSPTATYTVGDLARRDGVTYRCLVAHGAAYQGTWGPPTTGVWAVA